MGREREDLAGQRFGRLLVLGYSHTEGHSLRWRCVCDCGTEKTLRGSVLRRGTTQSCGCLRRETTIKRSTKHGLMTRDGKTRPTYNSWSNMVRRCTNSRHPRWADWGGRGITVCDRWREYPAFLADMGEKPPGTTLDRIDNDGNYEPGNCRWATHAQQQANRRSFKLTPQMVLDIQRLYNQGLTTSAIAAKVGMGRHTVGTVCIVLESLKGDRSL